VTTKYKTPQGYVAPLQSKAAMIDYLLHGGTHEARGWGHGESFLFAWNVKVHCPDFDFDHLLNLNGGDWKKDDPIWIEGCRERFGENEDDLFEWAIEDCQRSVLDDDTYKCLWCEDVYSAVWSFQGRSAGWLCLREIFGIDLTGSGEGRELFEDIEYRNLKRLYRFAVQCSHDFRRESVKSMVEYAAAFAFFVNVCSDVETSEDRQTRWALDQSGEHDSPLEMAVAS